MTIDRAIEILNPEHREHYKNLDEVNEACRMGMEALERTRWIPCRERLPDTETEVLALCRRGGVSFVCPAMYEDGTIITSESIWNWNEIEGYGLYSEEADDWYINVGSYCTLCENVITHGFRDGNPSLDCTRLWRREDDYCSRGQRRDQSADVRNMGQFAGDGKTGGPNDADQH